jgi:hypothetical protein
MNRQQRAWACAVGIVPTTISNLALFQYGHSGLAWVLEITTAAGYFLWIVSARRPGPGRV